MTKIVWRVPFAAVLAGIFAGAAASTPDVVDSDFSRNTAMGSEALWEFTAKGISGGAHNTACGFASMYFNTTGSSNTACGYETLGYNSSGSFNTAEGNQALENNTTGFDNSAFGDNALLGDADAGNSGSSLPHIDRRVRGLRQGLEQRQCALGLRQAKQQFIERMIIDAAAAFSKLVRYLPIREILVQCGLA